MDARSLAQHIARARLEPLSGAMGLRSLYPVTACPRSLPELLSSLVGEYVPPAGLSPEEEQYLRNCAADDCPALTVSMDVCGYTRRTMDS